MVKRTATGAPSRDSGAWIRWILAIGLLVFAPLVAQANPDKPAVIPLGGEAGRVLRALELRSAVPRDYDSLALGHQRTKGVIRVKLDLGLPEKLEVILHPAGKTEATLRVRQQFETSLTLMDEGPHMDLLDWKHHVSPWTELETLGDDRFLLPIIWSTEFPPVATGEIVAAVREESATWKKNGYNPGDRWINLARRCSGPNEYPCGVSLSLIRLRIEIQVNGQWLDLQQVELVLPMGC